MLIRASEQLGIPLSETVMIGDSAADVEAGRRAGAHTIGIGPRAANADDVVDDLHTAIDLVLHGDPDPA